ncbi:hypothetical protein V5O48_010860 [Marasmius crinis-equi]|uniref:DNA (cytosine-5-)-methyltransferase n=1 Tax=Marasmius crinis-equi TaxID=585013 RepID=A0ABR3F748_9AGAR
MPSRRNRPSALEFSFGPRSPTPPPAIPQKRKQPERDEQEISARPALQKRERPAVDYYECPSDRVYSEGELELDGEGVAGQDEEGTKPVRSLNGFAMYDRAHRDELTFISDLLEDSVAREFALAGYVSTYVEPEDGALEEDIDGTPEQYVVLENADIQGFALEYRQEDDPPYIETESAWYVLQQPSNSYKPFWRHYYRPRRIAQICISLAMKRSTLNTEKFLEEFLGMADPFGQNYTKEDLEYEDVIQELHHAIQNPNFQAARSAPFIRDLLSKMPRPPRRQPIREAHSLPEEFLACFRNPDTALLRPENQNPTQVTNRIGRLGTGFFPESLKILGAEPKGKEGPSAKEIREAWKELKALVTRAKSTHKRRIDHEKQDRLSRNSEFTKVATIDEVPYRVGEVILMPAGEDQEEGKEAPELPDPEDPSLRDRSIADYFWLKFRFAKIRNINYNKKTAHVQWYTHSSNTVMQTFGHKQELFLLDHCDNVSLDLIVGKADVCHIDHTSRRYDGDEDFKVPHGKYFCKMMYNRANAQFTSFTTYPDHGRLRDKYCPVCALSANEKERLETDVIKEEPHSIGARIHGQNVHVNDFVLYHKASDKPSGPGLIGHIYQVDPHRGEFRVYKMGRISDLGDVLPENEVADERHLFLTEQTDDVPFGNVIRPICVRHPSSVPDLDKWTELSPEHFYVKFKFPTLPVTSWVSRRNLQHTNVRLCKLCFEEKSAWMTQLDQYNVERKLSTLDLFGGAGAFGVGMAAANKALKVNYAIELTPSAATTYSKNSPHTGVCNQCVNEVLKYIVKKKAGHNVDLPKQYFDGKTAIPEPPGEKDVEVIIAGLPCQPHSDLNMFKKADDRKSHLILTMLSYVDFYQPSYLFMENVPGFLRFHLKTTQKDRYTTEGGITLGGLKLMIRALTDMNYQVRFALLQAGHYGTPQDRIRFFLVAAKLGKPLPELPQPTHDFDNVNSLPMRLPNERVARPIVTGRGRALHKMVNIEDACHDLLRWDWKPPNPGRLTLEKRQQYRDRLEGRNDVEKVTMERCKISEAFCGVRPPRNYDHGPRTRYQKQARARGCTDLQHYTKIVRDPKIQRAWGIPLKPGADFKCDGLTSSRWAWIDIAWLHRSAG